ncbi:MAG: PRK06851 family protein [Firmicutes bacterium]|nr:PRK06851 family protein [Bacillota bacterium]
MGTGSIKKVFPGNNTAQGFYSFYDYIIEPDTTRIFVIKGGPGVGKSTFMKQIGMEMVEKGYDIEFHHCSSDNGSLDGVVIPEIGIAMIDGTAPHIVDPRNPGAVDEILHLGDFWDEKGMRTHKKEIIDANREVGRLFARAYRFLRAAQDIYNDWEIANMEAMDYAVANKHAVELINHIFSKRKVASRVGRARHLFATANTPDGPISYLDTIISPMKESFILVGEPGTGKSTLLQKVTNAAVERWGLAEVYHCALDPQKVEHVVIPELGTALITSEDPHAFTPGPKDVAVNLNEGLNRRIVEKYRDVVDYDRRTYMELFYRGISFIAQAKKTHDYMETFYVPNMDFEGVSRLRQKTLDRILAYAGELKAGS